MAGYVRQDTLNNIADGNIINASDFDNEYDAIEAAFSAVSGHTHDGTAAEGAPITKVGPTQDVVVSISSVLPKTDNTIDLGSSLFEFKDLYIDGTANIDSLVADTADINAGTIDGVTIGGANAGAGTFTNLTASGTSTFSALTASTTLALNASKQMISVTNTGTGNNVLSASPTFTGTIAGVSMQLSSLTSGRVTYAGTSGLLQDSANFTFNGTDLTVSGLVNATTLDATNLEVTNLKAKDGTVAAAIANSTGIITVSTQLQVDNLNLSANTLSSTNSNGDILLTPNGTGRTTVTNLSATSPRFTTGINDSNGNELFLLTATASAVNEITVANAATGNAPKFTASGGDTNIDLILAAKGTGQVKETWSSANWALASQYDIGTNANQIPLNQYLGTMAFQDADAVNVGFIRSNATTGSGYALGAGSTVTQATSRTTGVTINAACGAITLVSAAGTTTPASFTVTNSSVAATDVIILSQKSGTDKYVLLVTAVAAGSFEITAYTTGGTTTEQPVINFAVIKAVTA